MIIGLKTLIWLIATLLLWNLLSSSAQGAGRGNRASPSAV